MPEMKGGKVHARDLVQSVENPAYTQYAYGFRCCEDQGRAFAD